MKNAIKMQVLIILIAIMCIGIIPAKAVEGVKEDAVKIFVAPTGDDQNTGTEERPLKSLSAARDAARKSDRENAEIILRGGEYNLTDTLIIDGQDSNVKWTNYPGEVPIVTSAKPITDWKIHDAEKNIYKASVTDGFNTRQLYFNGEKAKRSRSISYDGGYTNLDRTCELGLNSRNNRELYFYRDEVSDWNNYEDVEIHLLTAWADNILRLKRYDEENSFKITTVDNVSEGITDAAAVKVQDIEANRIFNRAHPDITGTTRGYMSRSYYYFENAYEFIDEDTEWYLDRKTNTVYFKAPAGTDMEKASITVPVLETLVKIEGKKDEKVCNLTFENIVFECSSWTRPSEEGVVGAQACQYTLTTTLDNETTVYHPSGGVFAVYADKLSVNGCTFRKMGATALDLYYGVTNSTVFNNEVYDVAGNGISVAKFVQDENTEYHTAYNPTDKSEITRNIDIINNRVHDIGTEYEGAVGIIAGYPENIVIAHNNIYNAPYSGISVGFGWSSADNAMKNNIIFANKLYDVGRVLCDFGGIYTLSKQPQSVCAENYISNVGRQAWFDYGYAAMYFDEQTEGYTIADNLLCNIGSDAWGGGINFNGCRTKNNLKTNYINKPIDTNEITLSVYKEAGIKENADCALLAEEAKAYLDKIINPTEPYDETDYYISKEVTPIRATATAADSGSCAEYAIDKNDGTVYTLSGQSADSVNNEYLLIELDGSEIIDKIKIARQYNAGGSNDNNYWADWCLAVGCELQGSVDGETWETLGVMNTWPDGTGDMSEDIYTLENPKAYKYIRYIRTKYKTGGDYAVWKWSSTDGGNRLNVKQISFYTTVPAIKLDAVSVSATGCDEGSNPLYAVDSNPRTAYALSGQTAESVNNEYLLIELDGKRTVDKIIIRRQFNAGGMLSDNSYWADWCLAVGCELQGSVDGETWETVGVMNTWPDGTGETAKEIFEPEEPKAYKYIRYIRTKYKTGGDYAVWRWSDSDGGNRLNVKEIEFYTSQKLYISNLEKADDMITVTLENVFDAKGVLCVVSYSGDTLIEVSVLKIEEGKNGYNVPFVSGAKNVKAMVLDLDSIKPLCSWKEIILED